MRLGREIVETWKAEVRQTSVHSYISSIFGSPLPISVHAEPAFSMCKLNLPSMR